MLAPAFMTLDISDIVIVYLAVSLAMLVMVVVIQLPDAVPTIATYLSVFYAHPLFPQSIA